MKRKIRSASFIGMILIILFFGFCTKETETVKIHGYVKNSAGVGLNGVTVNSGSVAVFTNTSGYYEMEGLKPGSLMIIFIKNGYLDRNVSRTLSSGEMGEVNVELNVPGWKDTWFSGNFGANFSAAGPSLGNQDQNTDFDYNGAEFFTPNRMDGIVDLGPIADLGSIDHVPETGYHSSVTAYAGNAYSIRTTEGNYVKLRVNSLDSGNQAVYFDWYYQANGGIQF